MFLKKTLHRPQNYNEESNTEVSHVIWAARFYLWIQILFSMSLLLNIKSFTLINFQKDTNPGIDTIFVCR